MTADGEEPLFGPIDGEPQIELVIRISPGTRPLRSPFIRAAIASLERSISRRGRHGGTGGDPRPRQPEPVPAPLVDGLEELLATLSGEADDLLGVVPGDRRLGGGGAGEGDEKEECAGDGTGS